MIARRFATVVGTAAVAGTLGLAAVVSAAAAGATTTDDTFITVLSDEGIEAPSPDQAIGVAHDVCVMFDDGSDLLDAVSAVSDYTELGFEDSAFFVGVSVASYCPEHEVQLEA